ncbi:MAG: hypothetical protein H6811_00040 [Phycisphaeraceae bacterium]|nr:hypothetical protein [Phycisphaeraceae bacterium]
MLGRWKRRGGRGREGDRPDETDRPADRAGASGLPEWADFFGAPDHLARFEDLVREYFRAREVNVKVDDGWVEADDGVKFGLTNVGQVCAQAESDDWERIITEHFDGIRAQMDEHKRFREELTTYSAVRERFAARLWDRDRVPDTFVKILTIEAAPDLLAAIMVDSERSAGSIPIEAFESWGVDREEVMAQALDNVARMEREAKAVRLGDERTPEVYLIQGETMYGAALALMLERFPQTLSPHGTLVSTPVRNVAVAMPIRDAHSAEVLGGFIGMTLHMEQEGPGSVSKRVWWRRADDWLEIPYEATKKGELRITPPEEFKQMVLGLGE